jgi:hypothetical protein
MRRCLAARYMPLVSGQRLPLIPDERKASADEDERRRATSRHPCAGTPQGGQPLPFIHSPHPTVVQFIHRVSSRKSASMTMCDGLRTERDADATKSGPRQPALESTQNLSWLDAAILARIRSSSSPPNPTRRWSGAKQTPKSRQWSAARPPAAHSTPPCRILAGVRPEEICC